MSIEDVLLALRAADEGAIDREALSRILSIIDTWDRGGLHRSAGELLTREFRVDPSRVRRWEGEITGRSRRRIGRYQLRRKIGQGGMGVVFEARDPNLGRPVALKLLSSDRLDSPESIQRFLREAKSAGSFNHPNIVHAYDAGIDGDLPFLVMEYVDGENLYQVLKRRGALPVDEVIDWTIQAAKALDVLQRQRWVHGDVKPSNFILTRRGSVKLADLGLCGPPGRPRAGVSPHGTPPYIAPEVLAADFIDHRADLYSLGATAYHLLVGRPPRLARSIEALRAEIEDPIRPASELRAEIPPALDALLLQLLENDPQARPPGGRAVVQELRRLERATESEGGGALSPPSTEDGAGSSRRWAVVAAVILLGVLIGILAGPGETPPLTSPTGETTPPDPIEESTGPEEALEARWQELLSTEPRDYPALHRWLDERDAADPSIVEWRSEVARLLEAEAAPIWREIERAARAALREGRLESALLLLDRLPARLAAGSFRLAREELVAAVMQARRERRAVALLRIESAPDARRAVRILAEGAQLEPADRRWLCEQLLAAPAVGEMLRALEEERRSAAAERLDRRMVLAAAIESGVLPPAELRAPSPEDLLRELALAWAATLPLTPEDSRSLLERLLAIDALADADARLLEQLLPRGATQPAATREIEAARHARELRAALEALDRDGAERAWGLLSAPEWIATAAARAVLRTAAEDRSRLRRAAFLHSDAFIAEVEGGWSGPVTFRWLPSHPRFDEEWRRIGRFTAEGEGLLAADRGDWHPLELAIPFRPGFRWSAPFAPPEGEWVLAIGHGRTALLVTGSGAAGDVRVQVGDPEESLNELRRGGGIDGSLPRDPAGRGLLLELHAGVGRWSLRGADPFPVEESPFPRWIALSLPPGGWIGPIQVVGEVVEPWLEARIEAAPRD
ncbi:MAG: protein kinase domain-containing protein [Planctomycetota bacterium]